jgi:hypothetical protein
MAIIASSVPQFVDKIDDDIASTRSAIFAISGRLRELAALVEKEASELDRTEWDKYAAPTIEPADEEDGPDAADTSD